VLTLISLSRNIAVSKIEQNTIAKSIMGAVINIR
jgi:hypothetical protein